MSDKTAKKPLRQKKTIQHYESGDEIVIMSDLSKSYHQRHYSDVRMIWEWIGHSV